MRTIILSPAHAENTPGKRSPDGKFREYKYCRDILEKVYENLKAKEISVVYLSPDKEPDKSFIRPNRVDEANKIKSPAFYFALHNNAAGDGTEWKNSTGVEIWTTKGRTASDGYAEKLYKKLQKDFSEIKEGKFWRGLKESDFIELMSKHPSILLEWLFQDSTIDMPMLLNEEMNQKLINSLTEFLIEVSNT